MPPRLRKQDLAQRNQGPLQLVRRRGPGPGGLSRAVLTPLTLTLWARRPLPDEGLHEADGLRLTERLQADLAERQVASQVGEIGGQFRTRLQPLPAPGAQPPAPPPIPFPM